MNCQEVMEYMQRELDGDLDERETEILMTHTRHCPECSTVFERLKLLSAGLDNLPKVTPSYSLVDAIMPKLLELQAAQSAESAADPVHADETEVFAPRRRQTPERRKNRFSYRIMGGVVAAGIVVGLVFITNPFQGLNSTNSKNDSALTADMSSADTASEGRLYSTESAMNSNAPKSNDEVRVSGNSGGASQGISAQDQMSPDSAGSPSSDSMQNKENPTAKGNAGSDSSVKGDQKSSSGGGSDQDVKGQLKSNSANGSMSGNAGGQSDAPSGQKAPLPSLAAPDPNANNTESDKGLAAAIPDPIVPSPDKRYAAAVVDAALQIYTTADNVKIFQGVKRDSGITNLSWSADSKTFTYETSAADGKKQVYIVDLAALSETLKAE